MKGRIILGFLTVSLAVLMTTCKIHAPTGLTDQDRAAILKISDNALRIVNAPEIDFEAFVKFYYTEDATTLPSHEPAVQGRDSQIAWYKAYPPVEIGEEILEIDGREDFAYTRLSYTLKLTIPGSTEPIVDTGKGLRIWKKQKDGSWKVSCDIYNSDLPIPRRENPKEGD
jgi:ketosteroid isomerase-like protein